MPVSPEIFDEAVRLGLADELDRWRLVARPTVDPYDRMSAAQRAEAIIRSCASGASAYDLPLATTYVEHIPTRRRVPPPPPRKGTP